MREPPWPAADTRDLLVRGGERDGEWIGLLTEAEAAKLTRPEGQAQGWHPGALGAVGDQAEYRLWTARVHPGDGPGGRMPTRYSDYRKVPGDTLHPQAGLMAVDGAAIFQGERGVLVLERDGDGGLTLVAVDAGSGDVRVDLRPGSLPAPPHTPR